MFSILFIFSCFLSTWDLLHKEIFCCLLFFLIHATYFGKDEVLIKYLWKCFHLCKLLQWLKKKKRHFSSKDGFPIFFNTLLKSMLLWWDVNNIVDVPYVFGINNSIYDGMFKRNLFCSHYVFIYCCILFLHYPYWNVLIYNAATSVYIIKWYMVSFTWCFQILFW